MYHCEEVSEKSSLTTQLSEYLNMLDDCDWVVTDDRLNKGDKRKIDGIMVLGNHRIAPYVNGVGSQSVNELKFRGNELYIDKKCISGFFVLDRVADMNSRVGDLNRQVHLIIKRDPTETNPNNLKYYKPEIFA